MRAWENGAVISREDVHRLVDAVPDAGLPEVEQALCRIVAMPGNTAPRLFSCAGTSSAEHDLAERSEDILRESNTAT